MAITIEVTGEPFYSIDPSCSWLLERVDRWRERTENRRRDPGRFHPSDLGRTDDEIIALYNGTAVEFSESAQKLRVFDNGHSVHARWGRYLRKSGLTVPKHPKKFFMRRLKLSGTCDEIVAGPDSLPWIVELKSINPFAFSRLITPKEEHIDQVHCYMAGLRILQSMLLYECKGTQSVKVFPVVFENDRWRAIQERLLRLQAIAESLPKPEERFSPEIIAASNALLDELESQTGEPLDPTDIRRPVALAVARERAHRT